MEIGKVPNDILKSIILGKLISSRSEILVRPGIGEDCCVVDFGEYSCVMSSDPITGAANEIGRLAVHITCNDVAACGVEPLGLLATILAPPGTQVEELEQIMEQLTSTAASINVDIMGGHTEITTAVTRFVIICTAVGKALKGKAVTTKGARPGDRLVVTKGVGLEGTAIIAFDREDELIGNIGAKLVNEAKSFMDSISVVKEGLIAAGFGVSAMHDVTEGGILGAVWELCEASDTGAEIYAEKIPVAASTRSICEFYGLDPFRLISSGCMLMAAPDGEGLVRLLEDNGIKAAVIGQVTSGAGKLLITGKGKEHISPPEADELYKVIERKK